MLILFPQGVSNVPAWFVVKANCYARQHGKTPFVVYQAPWSVLQREIEREVLPMCIHEGLAITAFNVLAGGHVRSDAEEAQRRQTGEKGRTVMGMPWERTPAERAVCLVLERVAAELGTPHVSAVAIAYVMQKAPYVIPIVGGRKVEHLLGNIEALSLTLTDAHIKAIEDASPYSPGYPWDITVSDPRALEKKWGRTDACVVFSRATTARCPSSSPRRPRWSRSRSCRPSSPRRSRNYARTPSQRPPRPPRARTLPPMLAATWRVARRRRRGRGQRRARAAP